MPTGTLTMSAVTAPPVPTLRPPLLPRSSVSAVPDPQINPAQSTTTPPPPGRDAPSGDGPGGPAGREAVRGAAMVGKLKGAAIGAVIGPGMVLIGLPVAISALGFTGTGIAAGSIAAKMMSTAATANGGGVAAGSTVAVLQSIGAAGLSLGTKIGLTPLLSSFGAAIGAKLPKGKEAPPDDEDKESQSSDEDEDSDGSMAGTGKPPETAS
ncbi:uncharacterized protein ACIB01_013098 [Guaruba guarouba]